MKLNDRLYIFQSRFLFTPLVDPGSFRHMTIDQRNDKITRSIVLCTVCDVILSEDAIYAPKMIPKLIKLTALVARIPEWIHGDRWKSELCLFIVLTFDD